MANHTPQIDVLPNVDVLTDFTVGDTNLPIPQLAPIRWDDPTIGMVCYF